jgi:hypothetical protein
MYDCKMTRYRTTGKQHAHAPTNAIYATLLPSQNVPLLPIYTHSPTSTLVDTYKYTPTFQHYLFSTSKKCIAAYASTINAPQYTPSPIQSFHSAWTSKPKLLRIAEPGTSMSRPYLWSMRLRYLTSLTMRPSKA